MRIFDLIAQSYGVSGADKAPFEQFADEVAPELPEAVRERILMVALSYETLTDEEAEAVELKDVKERLCRALGDDVEITIEDIDSLSKVNCILDGGKKPH